MKLTPEPFYKIMDGDKTIELRLYDEKRQKIKIGDTIHFNNAERPFSIKTEVIGLYIFSTFEELLNRVPPVKCGGYSVKDLEKFYSLEEQQKYNVVGIEIKLVKESDN